MYTSNAHLLALRINMLNKLINNVISPELAVEFKKNLKDLIIFQFYIVRGRVIL